MDYASGKEKKWSHEAKNVVLGGGIKNNEGDCLAGMIFCFTFVLAFGGMAEWSIAAVLKTVEVRASGGSNPSPSAINAENQQIAKQTPSFTPKNVKLGVFCII